MYYVVISNCHGVILEVKSFDTRDEAVDYIAKLDDKYYMVTLRNDYYAVNTFCQE